MEKDGQAGEGEGGGGAGGGGAAAAEGPTAASIPSGKVEQVRAQWSVHEDGALAYHLQNEEISGKANFNRIQRQTVRQDVRVARMTQEELEQDAALKELERKRMREEEDARIAAEIHRRMMEEEEEREVAQKIRDEEYAKALQAKEEKRYQRFMEKKREKELEKERRRQERSNAGNAVEVDDGTAASAAVASAAGVAPIGRNNNVGSPTDGVTADDEDVQRLCREAQRVLHAHDDVASRANNNPGRERLSDRGSQYDSRQNDQRQQYQQQSQQHPQQQQQQQQQQALSRQQRHSRPPSGASQLSDLSAGGGGGATTDGSVSSTERRRISMEAEDAALARALHEEEKQRARRHREKREQRGEQRSDRTARAATEVDDGPPPGYVENDVEAEVVIQSADRREDPLRYTPDPESPVDLPSSLATAASGFVRESFAAAIGGGGSGGVSRFPSALPTSTSNASSVLDSSISSQGGGGGGEGSGDADASTSESFASTATSLMKVEVVEVPKPVDRRLRQQPQPLPSSLTQQPIDSGAAATTPMQPPLQPTTTEAMPLTPRSQRAKIKQIPSLSSPAQVRRLTTLNGTISISSDGEECDASTNQSKLIHWVEGNEGGISPLDSSAGENGGAGGRQPTENEASVAALPPPHPSSSSANVNHSIFRAPISVSRPARAASPPPVQLPAYPNARPSSLYGGGVVGVPSTPSSPFNGRGPTPDGAGYSRPASVYHTHTSSSSDRCSTPDKDVDVKNGGIFSRNRRGGSSKKKSPSSTGARNRNSIILLGGATEDQNGVLKIQSPVNCINVAMSIDPTYHRRLVNGDFNASSPVADICLRSDSELTTTPESPLADRRNGGAHVVHNGGARSYMDGRWKNHGAAAEDEDDDGDGANDFSPSSVPSASSAVAIPAYARDPRLSQDLSTLFPPVSPRNGAAADGGFLDGGFEAPKKRSQFAGGRDLVSPIIGDPFVEEDVAWMDGDVTGDSGLGRAELEEEEGNEDHPQPFMLVRGTKRATLRQSQATAAATAVAKENAGKKKRERSACKTQ